VGRIERYDVSTIERPTRADLERLARRRLDARRRGCELVLTGVGARLRLLLAMIGLDEVFVIGGEEPAASATTTAEAEPDG
jgi:anti-anti-sigma regulatory factor